MASSTSTSEKPKCSYGKVILSLENCILPPEKLHTTPSLLDGLDHESEADLRVLGCEMIQTSGVLLRLPQIAMATAQVLFQRFYYARSFISQKIDFVAMACVVLASKIEEHYRRIEAVINVFHHIKQMKCGHIIQPLLLDQNFINRKKQVIRAERQILKELGFCVHIKHPHKFIVTLLEILGLVNNQKLLQMAWNYANDGLRSDVYLRYRPETIACACIYLSARMLQISLPTKPPWYCVFGALEEDIHNICHSILVLYTRRKPDLEKLAKMVEDLRERREEAKLKALALLSIGKNQSVMQVTAACNETVEVENKMEENGDILKLSKDRRKRAYSPADCVYLQNDGKSNHSAKLANGYHRRHRHMSPSGNYKMSRRSDSLSPCKKNNCKKKTYSSSSSESPYAKRYSSSSSLSSDGYHKKHRRRSSSRRLHKYESVSPCTKHSESSSSDAQSSSSPQYKRYEEKYVRKCHKQRSNSRSKRCIAKSYHCSSHKEMTKHSHKQYNDHFSKDRYNSKRRHESDSHSHSSRHKHRRDRG